MSQSKAGKSEPVLVTGANGLLGRAVLARLGPSRRVCALVREQPRHPLPRGAVPIVHDLRRPRDPDLPEIPGTIVHLAQSPRYRDFPEGALDVFEVNVGSTQRLLDWARRQGVKRFIYASSGGVYGHGKAAFEEDAPVGAAATLGHYRASKICGEHLAEAYGGQMIVIILRFFFIYGPGQRRTMLIPQLVDNVLHGRPIFLQGQDGIRVNPVYVDDGAAAVEAATGLDGGETINVAGPQILSLREIGALIGEATARAPIFEVQSGAEPGYMIGDTAKMTRLLGAPRTGITDGLRRVMAADHAMTNARHA